MKFLKQTFEVVVPLRTVIGEKTCERVYGDNIYPLAEKLFEAKGIWWDNDMKLVKAEIIEKAEEEQ